MVYLIFVGVAAERVPVTLTTLPLVGVSIFLHSSFQRGLLREIVTGKVDTRSNPLYGFGRVVKLHSAFELERTAQLICTRGARVGVTMFSERTSFAL